MGSREQVDEESSVADRACKPGSRAISLTKICCSTRHNFSFSVCSQYLFAYFLCVEVSGQLRVTD